MCCYVTLDVMAFSAVINKSVPHCDSQSVPVIRIYKAMNMALSNSKLKYLLNKKHPKRFDIADRDGHSIRISLHDRLTFEYCYRHYNKATYIVLVKYPDISLK